MGRACLPCFDIIERPQRLHQTGENDERKSNFSSVILNEVKNLCSGLTFCYDAILHFVQNDRGGKGTNDRAVRRRTTEDGLSLVDPKYGIKQAKNDKLSG